ncbi:NAD(P)-dependent alcohol dehydrogenase [Tenacibaculum sp. SG-28]|uniref:NAD(P)-dependent alcohol dehydrogenase n=1 Tax=Tenacibaculum sp. SG-28 TaxID=754426 RepID=UPI000CF505F2|nr:NAD(P)-dependent alcohol dehydrogenase [Tenacibaculum sp. SG-28]PQJ20763.1 hypothetical protein BSU00_10775 [Tenacibaculum sp. SG-28]
MKAIVYKKYGLPREVLKVTSIKKPKPKKNEVLVKVFATTINDYDWNMVTGKPRLYRLFFGVIKPKRAVPGVELSGVVEEVGKNVNRFVVGDNVFGDISDFSYGAHAKYIAVHEDALEIKPEGLSHVEAASIPHASGLAFQAFDTIKTAANIKKVLINGAGGGVGSIAIQLARQRGCEVTAVDSSEKFSYLQCLGADHVIDYRSTDFTKGKNKYDFILDCKTSMPPFLYASILCKKGTYVSVGGSTFHLLFLYFYGILLNLFSSKSFRIASLHPNKNLLKIAQLYVDKKLQIKIEGPFIFGQIPALIEYFGSGKHLGKIAVSVHHDATTV